jgi:hypothetical protein
LVECNVAVGSRIHTGIGGSTFANSFNALVKASFSVSLKPSLLIVAVVLSSYHSIYLYFSDVWSNKKA